LTWEIGLRVVELDLVEELAEEVEEVEAVMVAHLAEDQVSIHLHQEVGEITLTAQEAVVAIMVEERVIGGRLAVSVTPKTKFWFLSTSK